jgi:hypothetical protein
MSITSQNCPIISDLILKYKSSIISTTYVASDAQAKKFGNPKCYDCKDPKKPKQIIDAASAEHFELNVKYF